MVDLSEVLRPHPDFAQIALLTCDVDGVLTDGGLYFGSAGLELVRFNVLDGLGLKALQRAGVRTAFVTQSYNGAIAARAKGLGIDHCLMGVEEKLTPVTELARDYGISLTQVCHIADDVNDLTLLAAVGIAVTVPGGVRRVQEASRFVTRSQGGNGAVRELCDAILDSRSVSKVNL
jgi:3-deoxy-D-manno-octulosonate 8-phosphate phosphatase (KDO 8-P phosphatase)